MLLLSLLFPATVAALDAATRSPAFHLSIRSDNETYNEKAVSACHQGALITSLCITDQSVNLTAPGPFALNTETASAGILEFNAPTPPTSDAPNSTSTWFPMNFWWDVYSNIVMGFFQPLNATEGIDPDRLMFSNATEDGGEILVMKAPVLDERLAPNWQPANASYVVNRWYVCDTWYPAPYQRTSVVWGLGEAEPQNPTCVKVDVVRVTA